MSPEPLTIAAVPARVHRGSMLDALTWLGIDVNRVESIIFHRTHLDVRVIVTDLGEGDDEYDDDGEVHYHHVTVPLTEDDADRPSPLTAVPATPVTPSDPLPTAPAGITWTTHPATYPTAETQAITMPEPERFDDIVAPPRHRDRTDR